MDSNFSTKFVLNCVVAALLNAIAVVSIYLAMNQRLAETDIVIKSYLNGCLIALVFYFLFFYLPNYRAHLRLSKYEGDDYIRSLKNELSNRKLYKVILTHWFLQRWRVKKSKWEE